MPSSASSAIAGQATSGNSKISPAGSPRSTRKKPSRRNWLIWNLARMRRGPGRIIRRALDPETRRSREPEPRPTLAGAMERHLSELFQANGAGLPPPGLYHRILREIEYPLIFAALAATRGNQLKGRRTFGAEPEYIAQEGARSRHKVDARAALGDIAPASQCHQPLGFAFIFSKKIRGPCSLKLIRP
jgi:DNA-binding protein Fis